VIKKALIILVFTLFAPNLAFASLSPEDIEVYKAAFRAADGKKFKKALNIANDAEDPLPRKAIYWKYLKTPKSGATFQEKSEFIDNNPNWPQINLLKQRLEESMPADLDDALVLEWFERHPPKSIDGIIRYADTLQRIDRIDEIVDQLREIWVSEYFTSKRQRHFLAKYKKHLKSEDHIARMDRLLWDRHTRSARRMINLVPKGWQALAKARMALYRRHGNVDAAIARVPKSLKNHPGLDYERLRWRRLKGKHESAMKLLLDPPKDLGRPDKWWRERDYQVRRLLKKEQYNLAYTLASIHGQTEGAPHAAAEFMCGWIALNYLNEPYTALPHFEQLYEKVKYPISIAKAAYWAGRAAQNVNETRKANAWFKRSAKHGTTFYGQLSYVELYKQANIRLPEQPPITRQDTRSFRANDSVQVVEDLAAIGRLNDITPFILNLASQSTTPGTKELAAMLARRVGRFDLSVTIARRALKQHAPLVLEGYPVVAIDREDGPEKALVNSIIRQESNFKVKAKSRAGARGLMQIMPSTARATARKLKVRYSRKKLLEDPEYNVKLGHAYMDGLLRQYDGSYVLTLAAYNAGPARVNKWLKEHGDPRKEVDVVNWIEKIPYSETRNYVMRVLENLGVYRTRLQRYPFDKRIFMALKLNLDNPANRYVWNSHINQVAWTWSDLTKKN